MLKINASKLRRKLSLRFALLLMVGALTAMPLTLNKVEAQSCWPGIFCANGEFNVGALVSSIDVTWMGQGRYLIKFNLQSGVGINGSCGFGQVTFVKITSSGGFTCGSGGNSNDVYSLQVSTKPQGLTHCGPGPFTVGYRLFAYPNNNASDPRKIHSNVTIDPANFTFQGQTIFSYAPIPAC